MCKVQCTYMYVHLCARVFSDKTKTCFKNPCRPITLESEVGNDIR